MSATCRRYDVSRTVFYRWRARLARYGPGGVHPTRRTARPGRAPELSVADERRVIAKALAWPTRGPQWVSDRLALQGLIVAQVTVWRALRRVGLNHRLARLAVLEDLSATTGLLTERTARRHRSRHVAAAQPGDLCSLDSFYIGKLKGVGKVWQLTGCDCASSFGWARVVVGEVTAVRMAAFLTAVVLPGYRAAGWRLKRVLTDNGKEFKARFGTTCADRQVRHTRTKPRHAWTNGFVERLQGTILHEHWRIAFRRHYFRSAPALQRSLDRFLVFYNTQRPHRGYRLRGRTPATVFHGAVAARASTPASLEEAGARREYVDGTVNTIPELDTLVYGRLDARGGFLIGLGRSRTRTSCCAITLLEERPAVPRVRRGQLPAAVANGADRGHRVVEDHRVLADRPRFNQVGESFARDSRDVGSVAIQHRRMVHQFDPQLGLQPLHPSHQGIDRAAGGAGGPLVHRHEDELVVSQGAGGRQRHVVGGPLPNEGIHLFEHPSTFGLEQRALRSEDPDTGVRRQLVE